MLRKRLLKCQELQIGLKKLELKLKNQCKRWYKFQRSWKQKKQCRKLLLYLELLKRLLRFLRLLKKSLRNKSSRKLFEKQKNELKFLFIKIDLSKLKFKRMYLLRQKKLLRKLLISLQKFQNLNKLCRSNKLFNKKQFRLLSKFLKSQKQKRL